MRQLSVFVGIAFTAIAAAVCGCYTNVPNDSDAETSSVPLLAIDTARDKKPAGAGVDEHIEVDPARNCEITVEFVNGLSEPFDVRCTDDVSHEILNLEFSLFRDGRHVKRTLTVEPRFVGDYKLKRLPKNESVVSTVHLLPWYRLEDLAAGPCVLRLTYDMSPGNVWKLTPAHLEKRVAIRVRRRANGEPEIEQLRRDQPSKSHPSSKG